MATWGRKGATAKTRRNEDGADMGLKACRVKGYYELNPQALTRSSALCAFAHCEIDPDGAVDDTQTRIRPQRLRARIPRNGMLAIHSKSPPDYDNACFTRSGVNGARRKRTPVASKMALAMAAVTGLVEGSPAPA